MVFWVQVSMQKNNVLFKRFFTSQGQTFLPVVLYLQRGRKRLVDKVAAGVIEVRGEKRSLDNSLPRLAAWESPRFTQKKVGLFCTSRGKTRGPDALPYTAEVSECFSRPPKRVACGEEKK